MRWKSHKTHCKYFLSIKISQQVTKIQIFTALEVFISNILFKLPTGKHKKNIPIKHKQIVDNSCESNILFNLHESDETIVFKGLHVTNIHNNTISSIT